MRDLMRHIEQAVRPVRAALRRKLEMREELLAHLQGIYEEELVRSGDEAVARDAALERFGSPEALSSQLATTVPWYDFLLPWFNPTHHRPPMSVCALAAWASVAYLSLSLVVLTVMAGVFARIGGLEYLAVVVVTAATIPPIVLVLCATAGAIHGVLRHPRVPRRAILYATALACYLLPGSLGLMLLCGVRVDGAIVAWAVATSIATPLVVVLVASQLGAEIRKDEQSLARITDWEAIELPGD